MTCRKDHGSGGRYNYVILWYFACVSSSHDDEELVNYCIMSVFNDLRPIRWFNVDSGGSRSFKSQQKRAVVRQLLSSAKAK